MTFLPCIFRTKKYRRQPRCGCLKRISWCTQYQREITPQDCNACTIRQEEYIETSSPVNVLEKSEEETVALGPYISIDADHVAALILAPLRLSVLTRQNTPILIIGSAGDWLIETTAGQKYVVKKADFETKFSDIVTAYEYPRQ